MSFDSQQNECAEICVGERFVKNTTCEKLLGVSIDQHLNFGDQVSPLCKKTSAKLGTLVSVTTCMFVEKWKIVMNCFLNRKFNLI